MGETASAVSTTVGLRGRAFELERLIRLLEGVDASQGSALVLLGGPGMGKTRLLDAVVSAAADTRVLRAVGIQSESAMAYAGLHQLLWPMLAELGEAPSPHARTLLQALGLVEGASVDRFGVALAALTMLTTLAGRQRLVCLIDDAQWLDRASLDALTFVARRLEAEPIGMVFAAQEESAGRFEGLEALALDELDAETAAQIVRDGVPHWVSPAVLERVVTLADGNPLALIELPRAMSAGQLRGAEPLPTPPTLGHRLERTFLTRIEQLDDDARAFFVLAAAADTPCDLATLEGAAAILGLDPCAADRLESAGLLAIDGGMVHILGSLARLVTYRAAVFSERRRAHLALADAMRGSNREERRAWHLAAAAAGPDEAVAGQLERAAYGAQRRGSHAAAAETLHRAAELSVEPSARSRRLVAAAEASWHAGIAHGVEGLLAEARPFGEDVDVAATAAMVEGAYVLSQGAAEDAFRVFVAGARRIAVDRPGHALALLCRAAEISWWTGRPEWAKEAADQGARVAIDDSPQAAFLAGTLAAGAAALDGSFHEAGTSIRRLARVAVAFDDPRLLMFAGETATLLGEDMVAHGFFARATTALRAAGSLSELPFALWLLASNDAWQGRLGAAWANAHEGLRLARETGESRSGTFGLAMLAHIAALQGREEECRRNAAEALASVSGREHASPPATIRWALGRLELGLGRPLDALDHLRAIRDPGSGIAHPIVALYAVPDLVEAAVRTEQREVAERALGEFERWGAAGSSWATSVAPRLRGLLAEGENAERLYLAAIAGQPGIPRPFERARSQLMLGEHLRRMRRRVDAREHLRAALATFEGLGVEPWAERTRVELRASGESARRRDPSTIDELTPQELQIARFVRQGSSNREVAAKLFLSSRTVEYHLRKVYTKLGISSRAQLGRVLDRLEDH